MLSAPFFQITRHRCRLLSNCLFIWVFLLAAGCSTSGDITPPPEFKPTPRVIATNPAEEDISPLLPPDPAEGKLVYQKDCASCHGIDGMGDGERTASFPAKPPMLGSLDYSRKISPIAWFSVITRGRMDRLMPGFTNNLSDRQRWDVTAYILSMGATSEQLSEGRELVGAYCQSCHGQELEGREGKAPSLVKPDQWSHSLDDISKVIREGKGSMPAVKELSDDVQRLNTAIFLRSRLFAPQPQTIESLGQQNSLTAQSPMPATPGAVDNTIRGKVVHGAGGVVPENLTVELIGYSGLDIVSSYRQTPNSDHEFLFQNLPEQEDIVYQLTLNYKGVEFSSPAIPGGMSDDWNNQFITIYEPTSDLTLVKAERMHIFFEFPKSDVIRIVQLYVLSNSGSSIVTAKKSGDPVVNYPLPAGAQNLRFQDGVPRNRFVKSADGFGDTRGIPPGSGMQLLYSYELPYSGDLMIPVKIALPVDMLNIMLPSIGVNIKSSQLTDLGEKTIQNSTWRIFTAGGLSTGSRLNLLVTGRPRQANPQTEEQNTGLAVGVISLFIVLMMIGATIFMELSIRKEKEKRKLIALNPGLTQAERNALLDAIIALDDQYHNGQIPPAAYRERRAELKNRLRGN